MKIRGAEKWNVFLFSHIKILQHFVCLICDNLYLDNFYLLWEIKLCFPKPEEFEAFSSPDRYISELIFAWLLFHCALNANVSFGLFLAMLHFSVLFTNRKIHVQQKNRPPKKQWETRGFRSTVSWRHRSISNQLKLSLKWRKMKQFDLIKIMGRNEISFFIQFFILKVRNFSEKKKFSVRDLTSA